MSSVTYSPVYRQGDPGSGIGGYDLADKRDLAFTYDYSSSGKLDHLCLYRPGTGTFWILINRQGTFNPVYQEGSGIGGYDLADNRDRAFSFDYNGTGKQDHICLYRPGTGTFWILENKDGNFSAVYRQGSPGSGIGGYDLLDDRDRAFPFDYAGSGKLDHICLYRPGTGTFWILKNTNGQFSPVYKQGSPGSGIGGYDLADNRDRAFSFDYNGKGKLDHLCLYRPGTGTFWILINRNGTFNPVYRQGAPGKGIGGYDLADNRDLAFAYDYDGSSKLDHLCFYRPGTGTFWILKNTNGSFSPLYRQGDPGNGIGSYDLADKRDLAFAYDYASNRQQNYIVLYRPGTGTIWILKRDGT